MNTNLLKLSKGEIFEFTVQTTYFPDEDCLNKLEPLTAYLPDRTSPVPTAFPGGDIGYIAMIGASGQSYGFDVQLNRVFDTLITFRGGIHNLTLHESPNSNDPKTYLPFIDSLHLDQSLLDDIATFHAEVQSKKQMEKREKKLSESAIVRIKGAPALYPQTTLSVNGQERDVAIIGYHQTYLDRHNRIFSEALLKEKAITLYEGFDSSYLYDAFSETSDNCFFTSIEEKAKELPLYTVSFTNEAHFEVIEE